MKMTMKELMELAPATTQNTSDDFFASAVQIVEPLPEGVYTDVTLEQAELANRITSSGVCKTVLNIIVKDGDKKYRVALFNNNSEIFSSHLRGLIEQTGAKPAEHSLQAYNEAFEKVLGKPITIGAVEVNSFTNYTIEKARVMTSVVNALVRKANQALNDIDDRA
jgi:hypothetical protein